MSTSTQTELLAKLQKSIRINFKNKKLLENAFIHRSFLNEHKEFKGDSNERLEFLGDSVLSVVVSHHLFKKLPKTPEGKLTQIRASLVRTETLAQIARELSLGEYLFLSKGEEDSQGRESRTILANTFEALIGAVYLDQGIEKAGDFINKYILERWEDLVKTATADNKSKLQEILQRKHHQSPTYKLLKSWGPDHDRRFEVGVFLKDELLGVGTGKNKQSAAQNAAESALTGLKEKSLS